MKSTKINKFEKVFRKPVEEKTLRYGISARNKKQNSLSTSIYDSYSNNSLEQSSKSTNQNPANITGPLPPVFSAQKANKTYRTSFYDPLIPQFSSPDQGNSYQDAVTTSTTVRTERSSTPNTVRTKNPQSSNLSSYYLPLTTRRDRYSSSDSYYPSDLSFGNDPRSFTPPPKINSVALKNAAETSRDTMRNQSVISFANLNNASQETDVRELRGGNIHSRSYLMAKMDKSKKEEPESTRREKELKKIILEFQLSESQFGKDLSIEKREELAAKLLSKQMTERLRQHEEKHSIRAQERKVSQKEYESHKQPTTDPRANLLATMKIPTKYPALKGKILDRILDTEQLKKSRDEIFLQKFRPRKEAIKTTQTPEIDSEPGIEFNEKKVRLQNMEKSVPLSDLRFKQQFDEWLNDELGPRIIDKIEFLTKYHSINFAFRVKRRYNKEVLSNSFSEGTKFDPALPTESDEEEMAQKMLKNEKDLEHNPNFKRAKAQARSFSFLAINSLKKKDPELNKWLIYLTKFKNTIFNSDGTMQHITHHPTEYSREYWAFIRRRRRFQDSAVQVKKRDPKALFQSMFTKIRAVNKLKRDNKTEQSRIRLKRIREMQPEALKDIKNAKREAINKYHSLYSHLHWDEEIENRYCGVRGMTKHFVPFRNLGCANAVATFEFFKYEQSISKEKKKIEAKDFEKKSKFYYLNSNPYNRRIVQEEIDSLDQKVFDKLEFEVANQVVSEYEQHQAHLYGKRMIFLKDEKEKKKQVQKEKSLESQRKERIALAREEHLKFSNHIRKILEKKSNNSKSIDENFANTKFYQKIQADYSKMNNIEKINRKIQIKRAFDNSVGKNSNDEERDLIVADTVQRKKRVKMRTKMARLYTGGPRMFVNKMRETNKEAREKAAIQLQAFFRGALARIKFKQELELKRSRERAAKKKNTTRFKLF